MPLASQSSPFAAILQAVLARLASALNVGPEFVVAVASQKYVLTELEDLSLRVWCSKPRPVNPGTGATLDDQGAGRLALDIARIIRVYVYTRSGVDTSESDTGGLMGSEPTATVTDEPLIAGHFLTEERVLNALQSFWPAGESGTGLSVGPLRWSPDNGEPEREAEDSDGMIRSHLDFEVVYKASIDTTDPAA